MLRVLVLALGVFLAACKTTGDSPSSDGGESIRFACDVRDGGCSPGDRCVYVRLPNGDVATRCRAEACDILAQDCVPGDKCTFIPSDAGTVRACVSAGSDGLDQGCGGTVTSDSCASGLLCASSDDGGTSCAQLCGDIVRGSDCPAGLSCSVALDLPGTDEIAVLCGPQPSSCDLLIQSCGSETLACYPGPQQPRCLPIGNISAGNACSAANDCVAGEICVANVCRLICQFPSGTPSCGGGRCESVSVPGQSNVGACF